MSAGRENEVSSVPQWADEQERIRRFHREGGVREKGFFGFEDRAHQLRVQQRERVTLDLLLESGYDRLAPLEILEFGCGEGDGFGRWLEWGADRQRLHGIDLRRDAVEVASARFGVDVRMGCGSALPWSDSTFDLVAAQTVFSSIEVEELRRRCALEISRTLRPGGAVLWYDTARSNPARPDMPCFSEREIRGLFPSFSLRSRAVTVRPPWARRVPRAWLELIYEGWSRLPGVRSHRLVLLTKPARMEATNE